MRHITFSRIGLMLILVLAFGFTACGYAYQSQTNNNTTGTTSAATPVPTKTIASTPKPTSVSSTALTPGQVKLVLNKTQYAPDEVVTVSILNGLTSNIYTTNHQSACSILLIEWQSNTGWVTIGRCLVETPTGEVLLRAGSTTTLQFKPLSATPRPTSTDLWRTGTYRVTLFYHPAPDESSVQGLHAQSVEFTIS